jgi:hypothetical protein
MADESWEALVKAAEENGFAEPAPLGTYTVRVEGAEAGESSQKKTPQIEFKLKITEGPHAGKRPTTFAARIYKTEKAAGMFLGNMGAFGITGKTLITHKPTLAQIARVCIGKTVQITTRLDRQGRKSNDGSDIIEMAGTFKAPLTGAAEVTSFPPVTAAAIDNAVSAGGYATDPGF